MLTIIGFTVLVGMVFAIRLGNFEGIIFRILELNNISQSASWTTRLINWETNLALVQDNLFFGVGPLSRAGLGAADNDWLLFVRSYGFLGLLFVCIVFASNKMHLNNKSAFVFACSITLFCSTMMIT